MNLYGSFFHVNGVDPSGLCPDEIDELIEETLPEMETPDLEDEIPGSDEDAESDGTETETEEKPRKGEGENDHEDIKNKSGKKLKPLDPKKIKPRKRICGKGFCIKAWVIGQTHSRWEVCPGGKNCWMW
jgi:hypothetical protein